MIPANDRAALRATRPGRDDQFVKRNAVDANVQKRADDKSDQEKINLYDRPDDRIGEKKSPLHQFLYVTAGSLRSIKGRFYTRRGEKEQE